MISFMSGKLHPTSCSLFWCEVNSQHSHKVCWVSRGFCQFHVARFHGVSHPPQVLLERSTTPIEFFDRGGNGCGLWIRCNEAFWTGICLTKAPWVRASRLYLRSGKCCKLGTQINIRIWMCVCAVICWEVVWICSPLNLFVWSWIRCCSYTLVVHWLQYITLSR
jgi:hypothetical protein